MDKHLNYFFPYNNDNDLIENNLTRAFIVTLKGINNNTRNAIMTKLHQEFSKYDFSNAKFAFQNHIKINTQNIKNKYTVTIATDTFCYLETEIKKYDRDRIKSILHSNITFIEDDPILNELCADSRPDAWIYNIDTSNYCFMIECKKQSDYLYYPQLIRHGHIHFGFNGIDEIDASLIKLTWIEVLDAIIVILHENKYENNQEKFLLENFIQYMAFFGYHKFSGFHFNQIVSPLPIKILYFHTENEKLELFKLNMMKRLPTITIKSSQDMDLFNFDDIKPCLKLIIKYNP